MLDGNREIRENGRPRPEKRGDAPGAQLEAYRTITRQSDMVLAVYDPASARGDDTDAAIQYARELKRPILSIHPDTLRTSCLTEFEFM